MYNNTKLEENSTPQHLYDAFNSLVFSSDDKILARYVARALVFQQVIDIPGDVVELGVFKGSGMATFLKLKHMFLPKISPMKVVGFDCFNTQALLESMDTGPDHARLKELFESRKHSLSQLSVDDIIYKLLKSGNERNEFELIDGDICETIHKFVEERPGFRARLVYVDVDVYRPTLESLKALWDRVPRGGAIVFDEYGIDQWSESNAVDDFFFDDKSAVLWSTGIPCPTAIYFKK